MRTATRLSTAFLTALPFVGMAAILAGVSSLPSNPLAGVFVLACAVVALLGGVAFGLADEFLPH